MHRLHELRCALRVGVGGRRVRRIVRRFVAECAPHPLEPAGVRIEDDDPAIAVAVGDEELVRRRVYEGICRLIEVLRIGVAAASSGTADLHDERAVLGELQDLMVVGAVATDPHEASWIDVDAVFRRGPVEPRTRTAPGASDSSFGSELDDRRRGLVLLISAKRAWTL